MAQWPPGAEEIIDSEWSRRDLQPGDLLFCARDEGTLTMLGRVSNEEWRHVGSVTETDAGDLVVVENIGPRFTHRPLDDFFHAYHSFGAARLGLPAVNVAAANKWMTQRVVDDGEDTVYAWDDLVLAGLIAVTKRGIFLGRRSRVRAALAAASAVCKERLEREGKASLTCSAFIQLAYDQTGGDATIEHERWRSHATDWPPHLASLDEFFDEADESILAGYSDANLVDLVLGLDRQDRYINSEFHISRDQVGELARVLMHAVLGYALHDEPVDLHHDGRWITPGDLWSSPTVQARGRILL